jgi:carbon monoxide dehydrogenase subunit G
MSELLITRSVRVAATAADVWTTLSALDRISDWADNVDHSTMTTEQIEGVGAARRVQAGRLALIETVTVWEPGHALAYTIDGLPPLVRSVTNRWRLDGVVGGTLVSLTTAIDPGASVKGRIGSRILAAALTRASKQMLAGLAAQPWSGLPSATGRDARDRSGGS